MALEYLSGIFYLELRCDIFQVKLQESIPVITSLNILDIVAGFLNEVKSTLFHVQFSKYLIVKHVGYAEHSGEKPHYRLSISNT